MAFQKRALKLAGTTRGVIFGRGFLWIMIVFVIGLLFYTAIKNSGPEGGARLVFSSLKQMENLQNVMKSPYYHGLDKDNMPYAVAADRAIQQDSETVLLENIKADIQTKNNKWIALHAGAGEMKLTGKTLMLTKNADMFYDGGYEFRTESAFIDLNDNTAKGDKPVTGQGPMGTLQADRFSIIERGQRIRFEGNVKVVIYRD